VSLVILSFLSKPQPWSSTSCPYTTLFRSSVNLVRRHTVRVLKRCSHANREVDKLHIRNRAEPLLPCYGHASVLTVRDKLVLCFIHVHQLLAYPIVRQRITVRVPIVSVRVDPGGRIDGLTYLNNAVHEQEYVHISFTMLSHSGKRTIRRARAQAWQDGSLEGGFLNLYIDKNTNAYICVPFLKTLHSCHTRALTSEKGPVDPTYYPTCTLHDYGS